MHPNRFLSFVKSIHPWMGEYVQNPDDSQVRYILDRILRELTPYLDWWISEEMENHLIALKKLSDFDGLEQICNYSGNRIYPQVIGKIRRIGREIEYWKSGGSTFPCVEHVNPISNIISGLIKSDATKLYKRPWEQLDIREKVICIKALHDIMAKSPICLIAKNEDSRLKKNQRGDNPWSTYDSPKTGNPIKRKMLRTQSLPAREEILNIL
jgi:hypothetical protein